MTKTVCPNCCTTTEVKLKPHLIIAGSVTFILGVVNLGINGAVFSYLTNYFYGAWWSGLFVMITGLLGILSIRRGVVVAACVVSIISILLAFTGVVVDGVGNSQMDSIETCASATSYYAVDDYQYYGNTQYNNDAMTCIQHYYSSDTDCYCVDSESNCYFLNGQEDCEVIITNYISDLKVSIALDVLCFVSVLAFSIITCFSICCPYGFRKKKTTNFKNDLGEDGRGSITTNPLQNDRRPVLERVATFGKMSSFKFSGSWNNKDAGSSNMSRESASEGVAMTDMSSVVTGGNAGSKQKKAMNGDVSSFANPMSSSTDMAFSPGIADFQFSPQPPPPPPRSASPVPASTSPVRSAVMAAGQANMASNPLARRKPPVKSNNNSSAVPNSTEEESHNASSNGGDGGDGSTTAAVSEEAVSGAEDD